MAAVVPEPSLGESVPTRSSREFALCPSGRVRVVAFAGNFRQPYSCRLPEVWGKIGSMYSEDAPDSVDASHERPGEPWVMPREYEIGGVRWLSDASREMARALHPLLAQVTREELAEGPPPWNEDAAIPAEASSLYRPMAVQHVWTVSIEDVADFNVDQFLTDLHGLADSMGGQMVRGMLDHISAVSEEYGNTVDATGRDFVDAFAESLETMDLSFDKDGRPKLTIIMHPGTVEKLRENPPTPEQEARIDAILSRRREEWLASRRRRDLP